MPNSTILTQGLTNESDDAPKKFKNIDTELFEFTWGRVPFGGSLPERMRSFQEEVVDKDMAGREIENTRRKVTKYEILKGIEPGETVTMPKYLVNYAAMHLARKMYKRKMYEGKSEAERSIGIVRVVNPAEEYKLQIQMVAENFDKLPESPVFPKAPELKPEPSVKPEPDNTPEQPKEPEQTQPENTTEAKKEEGKKPEEVSFKCEICGFVAKNKLGLSSHKRFKHKN